MAQVGVFLHRLAEVELLGEEAVLFHLLAMRVLSSSARTTRRRHDGVSLRRQAMAIHVDDISFHETGLACRLRQLPRSENVISWPTHRPLDTRNNAPDLNSR